MPLLVSSLLGFFSSSGPLAMFFLWIGKKFASKALILPIQFLVVGALVVAKVAFLIAVLTLLATLYNMLNDLISQLPTLLTQNDLISLAYNLMRAVGLIDAVKDAFAVFNVVFIALLLLFISKVVLHSLKDASDEFFKIGVLLQA
jgi:hypothetical protein